MAKTEPFDRYSDIYEQWFADHYYVFQSELLVLKQLVPENGKGVEIGVGTGRFAEPLGIKEGLDPSKAMINVAAERGIHVRRAVAENLPYYDNSFNFALMVTTICFVDDVEKSLAEIHRILKENGSLIVGFVDKNSTLGRFYEKIKDENLFYRYAVFYSTTEVINYLRDAGFEITEITQTVFGNLSDIRKTQQPKKGYGEGSFVIIKGTKTK